MNLRILIVDDNEMTLTLVSKILELEGYKVDIASNAIDTFNLIRLNKYDLLILDVMMPDMNGYDLCASLRSEPYNMTTPVMILTAEGNNLEKQRALACGANDLLTKPFNMENFNLHVKALLSPT
jgi:DNA-binding response OmpR family regulator